MGKLRPFEGRRQREIESRIQHALADIRPLLRIDDCGLDLVRYDASNGLALIRLEGGCPDCEMTAETYLEGISAHLRLHVPEVREVRAVGADTTEHG